jgi:DNA-binding MarR family transcriptional regulator
MARMDKAPCTPEEQRQAVDSFWEAFPPLWRSIQAHIRQAAQQHFNVTVDQFHILRHIRRGRDSVSALAEVRDLSRPAISQSVDLLVARGLVVRTTNPHDRRHVKLDLTPEGNALMDAIFDDTRCWMMDKFSPLSAREVHSLTRSLDSLKKII